MKKIILSILSVLTLVSLVACGDVTTSEDDTLGTETPDVEAPENNLPETDDETTEDETPEVETPEVPEVETPEEEDETPEVETPEVPEVETPEEEDETPEVPEVETPEEENETPEVETPEVIDPFQLFMELMNDNTASFTSTAIIYGENYDTIVTTIVCNNSFHTITEVNGVITEYYSKVLNDTLYSGVMYGEQIKGVTKTYDFNAQLAMGIILYLMDIDEGGFYTEDYINYSYYLDNEELLLEFKDDSTVEILLEDVFTITYDLTESDEFVVDVNMINNIIYFTLNEDVHVYGESATNTNVVLESEVNGKPVTYIAISAFMNSKLSSIIISDSVVYIADSAFDGASLKSAVIPNSVEYMGANVFAYSDIKSIVIPNSVTYIGAAAFEMCWWLETVEFAEDIQLEVLPKNMFNYCLYLSSVNIPNSVTTIEASVFESCEYLKSITIPSTVTTIGMCAFDMYAFGNIYTSLTEKPEGWHEWWCEGEYDTVNWGYVPN